MARVENMETFVCTSEDNRLVMVYLNSCRGDSKIYTQIYRREKLVEKLVLGKKSMNIHKKVG